MTAAHAHIQSLKAPVHVLMTCYLWVPNCQANGHSALLLRKTAEHLYSLSVWFGLTSTRVSDNYCLGGEWQIDITLSNTLTISCKCEWDKENMMKMIWCLKNCVARLEPFTFWPYPSVMWWVVKSRQSPPIWDFSYRLVIAMRQNSCD